MTTLAAALGALPLAIGFGEGSELRQPLGIAIIGGLIASQLLTLLTTPVVYVLLDKLRRAQPDERAAEPPRADARSDPSRLNETKPCDRFPSATPALLAPVLPAGRLRGRPDYQRPSAPTPAAYKEAPGARWVPAAPADALDRGAWWTLFGDPVLDRARRRRSRCRTRTSPPRSRRTRRRARSCASSARRCSRRVGARRQRAPHRRQRGAAPAHAAATRYQLEHRRELGARRLGPPAPRASRARSASAQASAADLAAARLSAQGELATDYFSLREADAEIACCAQTIDGYERALQITQNRYDAGIAAQDRRAAGADPARQRAGRPADAGSASARSFEHAIAVLVGKAPADFTLAAGAVERARAGGAAGRAVDAAAAPARHRRGRAPRRRRQRADRRRARRPTSRASA